MLVESFLKVRQLSKRAMSYIIGRSPGRGRHATVSSMRSPSVEGYLNEVSTMHVHGVARDVSNPEMRLGPVDSH